MNNIFYGATKEQAILNAEKAFNLSRKYLIINILEEPKNKTIFSILNRKNVKIEVSVNEEKKKFLDKLKQNIKKRENKLTDEELDNNKAIIVEFLEGLKSQNLSINFDYNINEENKEFYINFESSNNALLIGNKGSTINALQVFLQNLLILKCKQAANITLDAGNYKEKRNNFLINLAEDAAFKVRQTGEEVILEPMISFERKKIHDILLNFPDLDTKSEGKEPKRYVIIFPAKLEKG